MVGKERLQVLLVGKLLQITSDTDLVAVLAARSEADGVVQLLQASDRDSRVAARVNLSAGGSRNIDSRSGDDFRASGGFLIEMERCLLGTEAREQCRWLDEVDVVMEVFGQAV